MTTLKIYGSTIQGVSSGNIFGPQIEYDVTNQKINLYTSTTTNGFIFDVSNSKVSYVSSYNSFVIFNMSISTSIISNDILMNTGTNTGTSRTMIIEAGIGGTPSTSNISKLQMRSLTGGGATVDHSIQQYFNGAYYTLCVQNGTLPRINIPDGDIAVGVYRGFQVYQSSAIIVPNPAVDMDSRVDALTYNPTNAGIKVGSFTNTGRSLNASGTLNANGADYSEYMTKCSNFTVAKGDIIGINSAGYITNKFFEAVTFGIKSTNPCLVGGDIWASDLSIRPTHVEKLALWEATYENKRAMVDRIAFSGQVPVNISTASISAGDYVIPTQGDRDTIIAISIPSSKITFATYKLAVGRVIRKISASAALCIVIMH